MGAFKAFLGITKVLGNGKTPRNLVFECDPKLIKLFLSLLCFCIFMLMFLVCSTYASVCYFLSVPALFVFPIHVRSRTEHTCCKQPVTHQQQQQQQQQRSNVREEVLSKDAFLRVRVTPTSKSFQSFKSLEEVSKVSRFELTRPRKAFKRFVNLVLVN